MLTTLLVTLLVLVGLLAIPLGLDYRVNWHGRFQGDIRLRWLFGLVNVAIPTDTTAPAAKAEQVTAKRRRRRRNPKSRRKARPLAAWRLRPFRQRLIKFGRSLWQAINKRELRLQLRIGLDDPADTGQLWAFMGPLSAIASHSRSIEIAIEPDFQQSTLELDSSGRFRLIPLQLLGLTLALLLSPSFWRGMQHMRKAG